MKKRIILKKWVKVLLTIVMLFSIMILAGECENDTIFYLSKLIGIIVFILTSKLLLKYGGFNGNF